MSLIGTLVVSIVGDNKAFKSSLIDSKKQLSGFGAAVQKHSAAFMKTGAVMMGFAGAIGIAAIKVGKEFDKAYNKIRTGTGKTGKVLEGLKKDFRAVVKDVPNSLDEVSIAIADLNTRLGLTGKPLQAMAKQMLNLARITETDVNAVIRTSTRLFGDWDVAVEDQAETLDYLYKISQSTGVGIERLSDMTTTYGVQLRTVGFTLEESLALMGKWEKEGVSAEKMLGGLSMALGRFAKAQKEPEEAFRQLVKQIEEATTVGKAMELGVEALGTRAGPDFALAVREGRFAVEDFVAELAGSSETINQAAEDTMTLTEKFNLLKNQAKLTIEPLAKKLMDKLSPALKKITDKLADLDDETLESLANITLWGTAILGVGGIVLAVIPKIYQLRTAMISLSAATKIAFAEWLALAAGLAHFGIDVYTYVNAFKMLGDSTESWQRKFTYFIPFFDTFAVKFAEIIGLTEEQIKNVDTFTGGTVELNEVLESSERFIKKHSETLPLASAAMVDLIQNYQDGTLSAEGFKIGIEELRKATQNGKVDIEEAAGSVDGFTNKQELARIKVEAHTKAQKEAKQPIDETTKSIEEQAKAVDDLFNSLFELYNLNQSVTEATWDYEDALKEHNKVMANSSSTDRNKQESLFGVQDEMEDVIDAIWREYSAEGTSLERKEELRKKYIELKDEAVDRGFETEEAFKGIDEQFGIMTGGISSNIWGPGGIMFGYQAMYDKGVELDEQKVEPKIGLDTSEFYRKIRETGKAFAEAYAKYGYAGGGIVGYMKGGITGSDGFSLPVLTAAKGLITLPRADEGMLALLHPPELVLNPDQALKVLWRIANEPTGEKSSSIQNTFYISELIVREEADIHKIAEDLYDLQQTKQRGLGEK